MHQPIEWLMLQEIIIASTDPILKPETVVSSIIIHPVTGWNSPPHLWTHARASILCRSGIPGDAWFFLWIWPLLSISALWLHPSPWPNPDGAVCKTHPSRGSGCMVDGNHLGHNNYFPRFFLCSLLLPFSRLSLLGGIDLPFNGDNRSYGLLVRSE